MNDKAKAAALAAMLIDDHKMEMATATPFLDRLAAIFQWLRANGVSWGKIISLALSVYQIVQAGGSWQAIIAAIAALFGLPVGTPGPMLDVVGKSGS